MLKVGGSTGDAKALDFSYEACLLIIVRLNELLVELSFVIKNEKIL